MGGGIKRKSGVCRGCGQHRVLDIAGQYCMPCHREGRATNSERIKEIEEIMATDRLSTETEEESDYAAEERMRSHKKKDWEVGRGPGYYA